MSDEEKPMAESGGFCTTFSSDGKRGIMALLPSIIGPPIVNETTKVMDHLDEWVAKHDICMTSLEYSRAVRAIVNFIESEFRSYKADSESKRHFFAMNYYREAREYGIFVYNGDPTIRLLSKISSWSESLRNDLSAKSLKSLVFSLHKFVTVAIAEKINPSEQPQGL